ncbi:unnamed protein product [Amoebophrya sp. A120]|nr:unnamed protein product [Amoebophrya sp. A120]|eukprot:GSA120T00012644001.1
MHRPQLFPNSSSSSSTRLPANGTRTTPQKLHGGGASSASSSSGYKSTRPGKARISTGGSSAAFEPNGGPNVRGFFAQWDKGLSQIRKDLHEEACDMGRERDQIGKQRVRSYSSGAVNFSSAAGAVGGRQQGGSSGKARGAGNYSTPGKNKSSSNTTRAGAGGSHAPGATTESPSPTYRQRIPSEYQHFYEQEVDSDIYSKVQEHQTLFSKANLVNASEYKAIWQEHDEQFRAFQEHVEPGDRANNGEQVAENGGAASVRLPSEERIIAPAGAGAGATTVEGGTNTQLLRYSDIPWPPVNGDILEFCEALWAPGHPKQAYRIACRRWHPDKFLALYGHRIHPDDKEQVENRLKEVFQDIMNSKRC